MANKGLWVMKRIFVICFFSFFNDAPIFGMTVPYENKKECGIDEPLRDIKEVEKCPDQFQACLFCRKPLRIISVLSNSFNSHRSSRCFECSERAKSFLTNALLVTNDTTYADKPGLQAVTNLKHKEALQKGIEDYFQWADVALKKSYIKSLRAYRPHKDIFRSLKSGVAKPHFYLGATLNEAGQLIHIWSEELVIKPEDKKFVLDAEEARKHVAQIWLKYNFIGPETGTIKAIEVTDKMVTYQEGAVIPQTSDYGFDYEDDKSD
jgi:hypothetical protein